MSIRIICCLLALLSCLLNAAESRKVVLVTGASSGIVRAIVEQFSRDLAYKVYGTTRQDDLVGPYEGYALVKMDPGDTRSVGQAVAQIVKIDLRIDLLVNSAGYMVLGSVESIDPDRQLLDLFDVNVVGYARTTRAVVPVMRRNGGGSIINITSVQALEPRGLQESYSATRAAVEAMSLGQPSYLKDDGIDVLVFEPGATRTNLMKSSSVGLHKVEGDKTNRVMGDFVSMLEQRFANGMPPEQVAAQVYHLAGESSPNFRSFASAAVLQRAGAVYVEPSGNSLRHL